MNIKSVITSGALLGAAAFPAWAEVEEIINDDFQSYAGNTRPKTFLSLNFPSPAEEPNNGVIGVEYGSKTNKIFRLATATDEGISVENDPRLARAFTEVSFGSKGVLSLEFDYRNHGTATSWLQLGLSSENRPGADLEAVIFNGTAMPDKGGMYVRHGNLKVFPKGDEGKLLNLEKGTWYRAKLEINLADKTKRLLVQNLATGAEYETDWIPCHAVWSDDDSINEVVFALGEGNIRARYKFELDNLKVAHDRAGS